MDLIVGLIGFNHADSGTCLFWRTNRFRMYRNNVERGAAPAIPTPGKNQYFPGGCMHTERGETRNDYPTFCPSR